MPLRVDHAVWCACAAILVQPSWCVNYDAARKIERAKLFGGIHSFGYYFVDLRVGLKRPQRTSTIVDTGSSFTGFPCTACEHCGREHLDPLFNFSASSTAKWLTCGDPWCECRDDRCHYKQAYTEGSSIEGYFFDDYVELGDTFQKKLPVRMKWLGCHTEERKLFYTQAASGIMGLAPYGLGQLPSVLQALFTDKDHIQAPIFTMCLADEGGQLTVGGYDDSLHTSTVQWVSMVSAEYYAVTLKALWLGEMPAASSIPDTIIDSGTTYTFFPTVVYDAVLTFLRSYCQLHDCGANQDGDDCWRLHNPDGKLVLFPTIDFDFGTDAYVKWSPEAYMTRSDGDRVCYMFLRSDDNVLILGMSWMLGRDIIFDLGSAAVGIAQASCPKEVYDFDSHTQPKEPRAASRMPYKSREWQVQDTIKVLEHVAESGGGRSLGAASTACLMSAAGIAVISALTMLAHSHQAADVAPGKATSRCYAPLGSVSDTEPACPGPFLLNA